MSWPTRMTLARMGTFPKANLDNVRVNDKNGVNAEQLNPWMWQGIGAGLTAAKCWAVIQTVNGAAPTIVEHFEAWNPYDDGDPPTLARSAEGVVTLTYPAEVEDDAGTLVSPAISFAAAHLQDDLATTLAKARATASNVLTVRTFLSGVADDIPATRILVVGY